MLTVKSIATSFARLSIVPAHNTVPAHFSSGSADGWIRTLVAGLHDLDASRHIGGHDVTPGLIEDRLLDSGVRRAERFPIAEGGVEWGDVAVTD